MPNTYEIRKYAYYCPKCGQCHFITHGSNEICIVCGAKMIQSPLEYNLTEEKMQDDFAAFEQSRQRLFIDIISKSPEFDQYLFDHRDEILASQSSELDAQMEHGKAILEGRDKGNEFGVECPYCHATNVKKITNTSKALHTAVFGIFSMGRNAKNFHCNHCNSDF